MKTAKSKTATFTKEIFLDIVLDIGKSFSDDKKNNLSPKSNYLKTFQSHLDKHFQNKRAQ